MSFKQEPSVDNVDVERYFDFEQAIMSPASSNSKGKAPELHTPSTTRAFLAQQQQQQNAQSMFSGPSHQYDNYTQQTGLPTGALANALAANRNTAFHLGGYTNTTGSSSGGDFDFNAVMPQQPSFDATGDMDVDFNALDGFYDSGSGFVDPNMIGGQEDNSPPMARAEPVRVWPGMHTHQAELAKQQQQQEIQRQQHQKAGQQQPQPQPQPQGHKRNSSKASNGSKNDPIVEERISRLLNQMRHSSVASSNEDKTPQPTTTASQRSKKDEEEMDEDERLLASEEGKKLSSKERRQLRNKVSARAFRSRRKEYISQLEGEIALKGQENEELRAENDALKAENNRLTDLSKMLLSSPAFSNFLNDLSANGMPQLPASLTQSQQLTTSQPQQQAQVPKDVNPNRVPQPQQQNNSAQIGMALLPENNVEFNNWNSGMDFDFNQPQVYAVTELPEGPVIDSIDTGLLSGKSSTFTSSFSDVKDDVPAIEAIPKPELPAETPQVMVKEPTVPMVDETVEFDESDPSFALFVHSPSKPASESSEPEYRIFGDIQFEKAVARFDLIIEGEENTDTEVSAAVMARFEAICSSLDAASCRLSNMTSHL